MAPRALPVRTNSFDPGTLSILFADASPSPSTAWLTMIRAPVSAPDRAGPSLGRLSVIGIMGMGGAAVALEFHSRQ